MILLIFWLGVSSYLIITRVLPFIKRRRRYVKLIDKIPGPKSYPLIGSIGEVGRTPTNKIFDLHEKYKKTYGRIFRQWFSFRPNVMLMNAEDAEIILTSSINLDKSMGYKFLEIWLGTGLLTSTGSKWHRRRKLITPAFHFSILKTFADTIIENSFVFVEKLSEEETSSDFDVYPYVHKCTLDIICETAMGVKLSSQHGSSEYLQNVTDISVTLTYQILRPWLWIDMVHYFTENSRIQRRALKNVHEFTAKIIRQRREERKLALSEQKTNTDESIYKKKLAFLDMLFEYSETTAEPLSDDDIREEVDTFMFEGHDTTASGISWAIHSLGYYQDIQEKVYEELFNVFGSSLRPPTMNDIAELKYLECVIKESLRLNPPVPFIGRELTTDVTIGPYLLPAGTGVDINIYQINRDPKYFENPNEFNPNNFANDVDSKRHPFASIPFSAGPRNCIGQKFALLEEKILLSTLLRKYKIISLHKPEEMVKVPPLVLRAENGFHIKIEKRIRTND